ncbi:SDR family oxidoreductase [Streptomyces sp. INA 01156]
MATRIVGHGAGLTGSALDDSVERVRESLRDFQPVPRSGEPQDLAAVAAFLASDASSFLTGQENVVYGGLSLGRAWPRRSRHTRGRRRPGPRHEHGRAARVPPAPSSRIPGTARTTVLSVPAPHKEEHNVSTPDATPPPPRRPRPRTPGTCPTSPGSSSVCSAAPDRRARASRTGSPRPARR